MATSGQAAIYARISRDARGDMLGVSRQERECRELADRLDVEVLQVLVDDDRSAFSGKPRPSYTQLIDLVDSGAVDTVLAWHPDRLHRSPTELESFIDLIEENRARVVTVTAGEYDLSTPAGRMTARVVGAVARHESEHKSSRLRAKHRQLAETGRFPGGHGRAFGYEPDHYTIRETEAREIRTAIRHVLDGGALRAIARDWDERSVTTVRGKRWTPTMVKDLLMNARIAGYRELGGRTSGSPWVQRRIHIESEEHLVPGIVSREQVETARRILSDPARNKRHKQSRKYLLTGIATCRLCDARLVARPNGRKRPCYVCATGPGFSGCGGIRVVADDLESFVQEAIQEAFPENADALVQDTVLLPDGPIDQLEAVDERIRELARLYAEGSVQASAWAAASRELETRRHELEATASHQTADIATRQAAQNAVSNWATADFDEKRSYLFLVLDCVVIGPAVRGRNFFDPSRVTIRWAA